jgi:hypothetical protein
MGEPGGDLLSQHEVCTIIGVPSFHGPVRDGKGWVQRAMAAKRNWFARRLGGVRKKGRRLYVVMRYSSELLLQGYRIKPHGQLVLVSLTHYCASTPSLSTWWSSTTLQGDQVPGKSYLKASFTLRCFQRLSLPNLATRRYDWRHNRYTRGSSTPVLSY